MFTALELRNQMAFALDAEGSDHYRDAQDYIPSINASIRWLTSVISAAYGQDKIGEEFFRELSYSSVFLTNNNSRISFGVFPSEVWTILAVYPYPTVEVDTDKPVPPTPDSKQSYFLSNLIHVSSADSCKRLSIEEWAYNKENPFEAGFDRVDVCDDLKWYAYLSPINYNGLSTGNKSQELEIRPALVNKKATVFWVKKPSLITSINDTIEFPTSVFQLLFNKALYYIAYKQGDNTTIASISTSDIQQLINTL